MILSEEVLQFLKEPNFMVLGTLAADGTPHLTTVWFEYSDPVFRVSITTQRVKCKNILRDPKVGFLIYDLGNPYRYLHVRGTVTDVAKDGDFSFIDFLTRRYLGQDRYPYDPERKEERVILSIAPEKMFAQGFDRK